MTTALAVEGLTKRFGATLALDRVRLELERGEVHGLLGENGSGKSTLIKVLAGYYAPAPGARLEVGGRGLELPLRPGDARRLGIGFVHQELGLIPSLSVTENVRMSMLAVSTRLRISWARERDAVQRLLEGFGLEIDPRAAVGSLSQLERVQLAIARASADVTAEGVLALDEPTAFLPAVERRRLFELARRVAERGAAVLFVSHDLDEVLRHTDRVTVLRDGRNAGAMRTREADADTLARMILGRSPERIAPGARPPRGRVSHAVVRDLRGERVMGLGFELQPGEVLGLTGLAGSGAEEVPYLVFGARRARAGTLVLGGEHGLARMTPRRALDAGLALLPADRRLEGCVESLPLADNMTLLTLDRYRRRLRLDRRRQRADTAALLERFGVRPGRPDASFEELSGGNQQKALLAKTLASEPALLLLDEPTRGVDVGARGEIVTAIRAFARRGTSVLCASTDHEQLSALCDRVLVLAGGRPAAWLEGVDVTTERIADACFAAQ